MTKKDHHSKKLKYKNVNKNRKEKRPKKRYDKHATVKSIKNLSIGDIAYLEDLFEDEE